MPLVRSELCATISSMVSAFGWLDADGDQRRRMLEVVELFRESGTVDELGVGSVRDAIAEALFPGTSVLHTRLRYVLFIPWLLQRASEKDAPQDMVAELRRLEIRLIYSLLAGGETDGVIGQQARERLKRMPSAAYWAVLGHWQVRQVDTTVEGYFRRVRDHRRLTRRVAAADDPEAREYVPTPGLAPDLPPAPRDLLQRVTFALSPDEERYLSDAIAKTTKGSLLAWLVQHEAASSATWVWDLDAAGFPARLAEIVDHGRRFHTAIHGAPLLYNLLMAQRAGYDRLVADYENQLVRWREELAASRALESWDRASWWSMLAGLNRNLHTPSLTRRFVDRWLDIINSNAVVEHRADARKLVENREREMKGSRARLANRAALDVWRGDSGLVRLDYRWRIARQLLTDLYDARRA